MQFFELKSWIRDEAERMHLPCSSRQAHKIANVVIWSDVETDLIEAGLHETRTHADPTAVEAIRRVMREFLGAQEVAA